MEIELLPCLVAAESGSPLALTRIRQIEEDGSPFLEVLVGQHEKSEWSQETTMSGTSLVAIEVVFDIKFSAIQGEFCNVRVIEHHFDIQLHNTKRSKFHFRKSEILHTRSDSNRPRTILTGISFEI